MDAVASRPGVAADIRRPFRRHMAPAQRRWRRATHPLRRLPDVVVIGAQKAGTTALYHHLASHPDFVKPFRKEVDGFGPDHSVPRYRSFFPFWRGRRVFTGEATPSYLLRVQVAPVLARMRHCSFVAVLRDPVDRAFSQYQMNRRRGLEDLSFEDAIDAEGERTVDLSDVDRVDWSTRRIKLAFSYMARGRYVEQLSAWRDAAGDDRLFVTTSDRLREHPQETMDEVADHIGVRPWRVRPGLRSHQGGYRDGPRPELRDRLAAAFRDANAGLDAFLGFEPGW